MNMFTKTKPSSAAPPAERVRAIISALPKSAELLEAQTELVELREKHEALRVELGQLHFDRMKKGADAYGGIERRMRVISAEMESARESIKAARRHRDELNEPRDAEIAEAAGPVLKDAAAEVLAGLDRFEAGAEVFRQFAQQAPATVRMVPLEVPGLLGWRNYCRKILDPEAIA